MQSPEVKIPEELLHFVWRSKLIDLNGLHTTNGHGILILAFGHYNTNSGPDFLNGSIKLGTTTWYGQIEMHVNSSDWNKHNHNHDPAYDNVILHVVWNYDADIKRKDDTIIPTLCLKGLIDSKIIENYHSLAAAETWVSCQQQLPKLDLGFVPLWLSRLSVERIESKTAWLRDIWIASGKDWDQTFFVGLSAALGLKVNKDAFKRLAEVIPLSLLNKYSDNLHQLEALLFGGSGLLTNVKIDSDYTATLSKEFAFLNQKHQLTTMSAVNWKFSKLRPVNFPTIRIAQLARLIYARPRLFSNILTARTVEEIVGYFDISIVDGYWHDHYTFKQEPSAKKAKTIGKTLKESLVINLIVPLLFLYGKELDDQRYCDTSLDLLESIKPESNAIINNWSDLGIKAQNAKESQALLQLKNNYCSQKQCFKCQIGYKIIT